MGYERMLEALIHENENFKNYNKSMDIEMMIWVPCSGGLM